MKKNSCKAALFGKTEKKRETGGEWLIGAHTQNNFNINLSVVTTQQKTGQRRVGRLLMRVKSCRRVRGVLMMLRH